MDYLVYLDSIVFRASELKCLVQKDVGWELYIDGLSPIMISDNDKIAILERIYNIDKMNNPIIGFTSEA